MARQNIGGLIRAVPHNQNYKELFDKVFQLSGSVNPLEPVNIFSELVATYPMPTVGDAVYVIDEKVIYRWSGEEWQYFSDFTILNDVIDDTNNARDGAIEATNNVDTAVDNANAVASIASTKINEMDALRGTLNSEESIRIAKESERQTNETNRQTNTATAIANAKSATTKANNATTAANTATDNANVAASSAIDVATNLETTYAPRLSTVEGIRVHVGATEPTDTVFWLDTTAP